jgi:hypothetical protein
LHLVSALLGMPFPRKHYWGVGILTKNTIHFSVA